MRFNDYYFMRTQNYKPEEIGLIGTSMGDLQLTI